MWSTQNTRKEKKKYGIGNFEIILKLISQKHNFTNKYEISLMASHRIPILREKQSNSK